VKYYIIENGKSSRGQPRRRWMDKVVETTGLRLQQLKEAARDRVGWRDVVKSSPEDVCILMEQGDKVIL